MSTLLLIITGLIIVLINDSLFCNNVGLNSVGHACTALWKLPVHTNIRAHLKHLVILKKVIFNVFVRHLTIKLTCVCVYFNLEPMKSRFYGTP